MKETNKKEGMKIMGLEKEDEIRKNSFGPLKNKKWLFPETGKAGFHYDDVSNAVTGLKKDLRKTYNGLHEEELITQIEKWFPDVTEREQVSQMKQPRTSKETASMHEEGQLELVVYG